MCRRAPTPLLATPAPTPVTTAPGPHITDVPRPVLPLFPCALPCPAVLAAPPVTASAAAREAIGEPSHRSTSSSFPTHVSAPVLTRAHWSNTTQPRQLFPALAFSPAPGRVRPHWPRFFPLLPPVPSLAGAIACSLPFPALNEAALRSSGAPCPSVPRQLFPARATLPCLLLRGTVRAPARVPCVSSVLAVAVPADAMDDRAAFQANSSFFTPL